MLESHEIENYISVYAIDVQKRFVELFHFIQEIAPEAITKMSYGMPTLDLHGNLVHIGMAKKHIGFYPGPHAIETFQAELNGVNFSKGAIQFQNHQPVPFDLVRKIVCFRVMENKEKFRLNSQKKN